MGEIRNKLQKLWQLDPFWIFEADTGIFYLTILDVEINSVPILIIDFFFSGAKITNIS